MTVQQRGMFATAKEAISARLGFDEKVQIDLPTPDEALNIGWAYYFTSDPANPKTTRYALCMRVVQDFESIVTEPSTPERAYLISARSEIASYSRALARRKETYAQDREKAGVDYAQMKLRRVETSFRTIGLRALWKYVNAAFVAYATYMCSVLLTGILPASVAEKTGFTTAIFIGIFFGLMSLAASLLWSEYQRNLVENLHTQKLKVIEGEYARGRLREQMLSRLRLADSWKRYSGKEYPDTLSLHDMIADDILSRDIVDKKVELTSQRSMRRFHRYFRVFRQKLRRKKPKSISG